MNLEYVQTYFGFCMSRICRKRQHNALNMEEITMKISKIIAGMSAIALAAAVAVPVTADEAPQENGFYAATGYWTLNFDGSSMDNVAKVVDPEEGWDPGSCKGQLVGYTNAETGEVSYNFGCNFQVGHMKKAVVTIRVTSDTNNIYNGHEDGTGEAVSEGYMYTVQTSWNGDCSADFNSGWTHSFDADGNPKYANGATDLNGWNSGAGKFNGNWAQISLTDDNLSALHFEVTIDCTGNTTWEYHPYSEENADDYVYIICNGFGASGGFTPSSISGDGDPQIKTTTTDEGDMATVVVDGDYINSQFGGECRPGGDNSDGGDESKGDSKGDSSNGDSKGDSSNGSSSNGGNNNSKGGNGGGKGSNGGTTGTDASTGSGEAASDATENANSGAAAGVGLAIAALAGAAIVVSRKK